MKYLAERLKSARLINGLSLQGLADRIDNRVTKQALSKYEQGQVVPDSDMIGVLAEALKVRPDYFHTDTEVKFGEIEFRKLKNYLPRRKTGLLKLLKMNLAGILNWKKFWELKPSLKILLRT
mgnify:CR=1 FL=1